MENHNSKTAMRSPVCGWVACEPGRMKVRLIKRVCVRPVDLCVKKCRISAHHCNNIYVTMLLLVNWWGIITHSQTIGNKCTPTTFSIYCVRLSLKIIHSLMFYHWIYCSDYNQIIIALCKTLLTDIEGFKQWNIPPNRCPTTMFLVYS